MDQNSFSDAEYAGKRKKTRREVFFWGDGTGRAVEGAARVDRAAQPGRGSWLQASEHAAATAAMIALKSQSGGDPSSPPRAPFD